MAAQLADEPTIFMACFISIHTSHNRGPRKTEVLSREPQSSVVTGQASLPYRKISFRVTFLLLIFVDIYCFAQARQDLYDG